MPTQNLNTYYYPKYKTFLNSRQYFDLTLAADERDYDEEVVFSTDIIAANDGTRLPISLDLNNTDSCPQLTMAFDTFYTGATLLSKNYYNPDNLDLTCLSAFTGTCDVGLTATDNGLYTGMTGQTLYYTMGIRNDYKFHPHYYDRRMKFHMVTGYTTPPNVVFSGRPKTAMYNIVSKSAPSIGYYQELYGGFYQGFYKLFGYDYEVFPERMNKGWTMETVIKPRITDEFSISASTEEYLNTRYPDNAGTFFYFGTRAENKYYHFADGHPATDSGYTRVTSGLTSMSSCTCNQTGFTNANCIKIYPQSATTAYHNIGCGCGACTTLLPVEPLDPKFDVLSNALSIRFSGCAADPRICVKSIVITGDCVTTGSCSTSGITYTTGYTVDEYCTPPIYPFCLEQNPEWLLEEHWFQVNFVWERYTWLDTCDLWYRGGLGDITEEKFLESLANNTIALITVPYTHQLCNIDPEKIKWVSLNEKWLLDQQYRNGRLKIYVNGKLFYTIEDFKEIIPRALTTDKEKQVGVPYNISWGGGTQGLRENLTLTSCLLPYGPYQQDPECFPTNDFEGTSLEGSKTNIVLEETFAGTFEGGISQFRMYMTPLSAPEVKHNFNLLKDQFNMFNPDCPNCDTQVCVEGDITYEVVENIPPNICFSYNLNITPTPTNTVTPTVTPII